MNDSTFLLDAKTFMDDLDYFATKAKFSFYVQAMTFEGDEAGQALIDIMSKSPAKDKRILIDAYSTVVVNDRFVFSRHYIFDKDFRSEVQATKKLITKAKERGIKIKFTNPIGFFMSRYPCRNHKKIISIDGNRCYLGGINFSDHNFAWHDFMMRCDKKAISTAIHKDFLNTWEGNNANQRYRYEDDQLYLFNGIKSQALYDEFFQEI